MIKKHSKAEVVSFFDKWMPTFLPGWAYKVRFGRSPEQTDVAGYNASAMVEVFPLERELIFNIYVLRFDTEEENGGTPPMQTSMEHLIFHEMSHVILYQSLQEIEGFLNSLITFVTPSIVEGLRHQWFLREEGLINTLAVSLAAAVKDA